MLYEVFVSILSFNCSQSGYDLDMCWIDLYNYSRKQCIAIRDVAFRSAISIYSTRSKILRTVHMMPYTANPICLTMEHLPHTEKRDERDRLHSIKRLYHPLRPAGGCHLFLAIQGLSCIVFCLDTWKETA